MNSSRPRRPSAGVLIGLLAVFLALNGTTYAASAVRLITGAQVKNETLTSADVKDGSLAVADLSPVARASLKGSSGPQGVQGPAGVAGPAGPGGSPDSPAQELAKLLTVDGSGSGLDAELLDGLSPSAFVRPGDSVGGDLTGTAGAPLLGNGAVTTAKLADQAVDADKVAATPAIKVGLGSSMAVNNECVLAPLSGGEYFDATGMRDDGIWGGSQILISRAGLYSLNVEATFSPLAGVEDGSRGVRIQQYSLDGFYNDVAMSQTPPVVDGFTAVGVSRLIAAQQGERFRIEVCAQDSHGAVTALPGIIGDNFDVRWVSPLP